MGAGRELPRDKLRANVYSSAPCAGQADQDGRPSGAALPAVDLPVIRGVGSSTVVRGSVGSYRPVIAGTKLRESTTTIVPRGRERSRESACLQCAFTPLEGARRRQRWTRSMVHGKKRIPYWIDRRLTGLAGPEYHAIISFGLPSEPEDSQYGKSWLQGGVALIAAKAFLPLALGSTAIASTACGCDEGCHYGCLSQVSCICDYRCGIAGWPQFPDRVVKYKVGWMIGDECNCLFGNLATSCGYYTKVICDDCDTPFC